MFGESFLVAVSRNVDGELSLKYDGEFRLWCFWGFLKILHSIFEVILIVEIVEKFQEKL